MEQLTHSELAQRAKELFIKFPKMQSVTALGDGQFFDDAAGGSGSARTFAKENKIDVFTFDRSVLDEVTSEDLANNPIPVEKLKLGELQSMATEMGLLYEPSATRATLIELINQANEALKD